MCHNYSTQCSNAHNENNSQKYKNGNLRNYKDSEIQIRKL